MTSQLNTQLAAVLIDEPLRSAQYHRSGVHTYSTPVVHEIRTPVGPDALETSVW